MTTTLATTWDTIEIPDDMPQPPAAAGTVDRRTVRRWLTDAGLSGFQVDVLVELTKVKSGDVVTYGELAERVGRPGAARAVGSACAANPYPLLVPCHRVVPAGSGLGGFSGPGGVERKRQLLAAEGVNLG